MRGWAGRGAKSDERTIVVDSDNYGGGVLAARALLDAGRTRLGIITGPQDMEPARDRHAAGTKSSPRRGVAAGPIVHGDFTLDGGAAAMARLLQREPTLDGVFASSDLMASGAMRVLQASGRRVPADVSVIGFDDVLIAASSDPPLTTIRQPLEDMGRVAAEVSASSSSRAGPSTRPRPSDNAGATGVRVARDI